MAYKGGVGGLRLLFKRLVLVEAVVFAGNAVFGEMMPKAGLCVRCKGKLLCGLSRCPVLEKTRVKSRLKPKKEVFGPSPPNVFVGWKGYPRVFTGPLVSIAEGDTKCDAALFDSPAQWYGKGFEDIILFRSSLARGHKILEIRQKPPENRFLSDLQDSVLSIKPVDLEVEFEKEPRSPAVTFSDITQPMGPSAEVKKMRLAGNPVVPKKIDSLVSERLKVREALPDFLKAESDYYYLQKLLSAGVLGEKENKKLVPTRWAITAMDRMLADERLKTVKEQPTINEYLLYTNDYLDNHYEVLLLPGRWEFEQFEAWGAGSLWGSGELGVAREYEPFEGRSDYAEEEGGGYYAGRLACTEALHAMRRQARVLVIREIGSGYRLPVGVWAVREALRHAFKRAPTKFNSLRNTLADANSRLSNPIQVYASQSQVLKQKRLTDFG